MTTRQEADRHSARSCFRGLGFLVLPAVIMAAHAASPAVPAATRAALPAATAGIAKVLLVDDDESDNNNYPGDKRQSASDKFYAASLRSLGVTFDTVVVAHYKNGPALDALRPYTQVIWYTGAAYGGNPDNTSVISLDDEKTLEQYVQAGGTVILVSPGYLTNALGADTDRHWATTPNKFLTQVLGLKGGRGLLKRFQEGEATDTAGTRYPVGTVPGVETQFSAMNPSTATTLFKAPLTLDGKATQDLAVAIDQTLGAGHFTYIGFTLENVQLGGAAALGNLLKQAAPPASAPPAQPSRSVRTQTLTVAGTASRSARTDALVVTGTLSRTVKTEPLVVSGIRSREVRTETLTVTGAASRR